MDRVAVITDIHANLPALEAALARIEQLDTERIYCGGTWSATARTPTRYVR